MDEDYDACDLENWFLAIQSADGQVIIPSFHRPGIIRYDPKNGVNDWARTNPAGNWADSAARILRPVAADGHDLATFPDLVPDPATGKITFDVDNDADGITDSVWLDLGYPARPDASGRLSKPLFAFLVIGLNGRIPLNTAGNLAATAATGATHAAHLGNSVSELDPTYALQNANQGPAIDADPFNVEGFGMPPYTSNTQVDNAGIDVRLTQLRNLLAGTRPQPNPTTSRPRAGRSPRDDQRRRQLRPRCLARQRGRATLFHAQRHRGFRYDVLDQHQSSSGPADHPGRPGPLGRGPIGPRCTPSRAAGGQRYLNLVARPLIIIQSGRATPSASPTCSTARPRRSRRQLQPVRPLSDRSHRRGQRPRLLRLRRWPDAARRPDAPVRHAGRHRRLGPGAALGRPLARGRRRGRRGATSGGSTSPAISDPPAPRDSSASTPTAGRHPARSSIPRPITTSSTPAAPTRPI